MSYDEQPRSACYGDLRFTSNQPRDIAEAIAICGGCAFKACLEELAYAETDVAVLMNMEGVYDGRYYSPTTTKSSRKKAAA